MNIIPRGSLIILEASGISESFQEHVSNSTGCTIITLDPCGEERFVGFVPPAKPVMHASPEGFLIGLDDHPDTDTGCTCGVEQPEDPVVTATNTTYADMINALRPFAAINEFSVTGSRVFIDGVYRNVNAKTLFVETLSRRVKIISQMDDGSKFSIVGELIAGDDLAKTINELKPSDAAPWSCDVVHAVLSSPVAITETKRAQ